MRLHDVGSPSRAANPPDVILGQLRQLFLVKPDQGKRLEGKRKGKIVDLTPQKSDAATDGS